MPDIAEMPTKPLKGGKVGTLEQLQEIAARLREAGERIVLAHGTFDLCHVGHLRHLQAARAEGTKLFVTLTADRFVNKGPDRPVFTADLRAEMLAAFECTDYVAISNEPTALTVLRALKPHVYVKGSDYSDEAADVTGNITRERLEVERHGGRMLLTNDLTFSSSNLINRHLMPRGPAVEAFLDRIRSPNVSSQIHDLIDSVADLKVLIVGDTIIDQYDYVAPLGKPPKETLIATNYESTEIFAGGVIAAANHVASFCREIEIITCLGDRDAHRELIEATLKPNVKLTAHTRANSPTTRKVRYVESSYMRKLFEVYHMNDKPLSGLDEAWMLRELARKIDEADVVLVTDFGHGLITSPMIELLCTRARFLAVNTQTNSANAGFNLITRYPRADYICIDAPEARLAARDKFSTMEQIVSETLPSLIDCQNIIVTHGRNGCLAYNPEQGLVHIPALASSVLDTIGAGDAFLAVTSPLMAVAHRIDHVGLIGNAAGAIKVGILGHRSAVERLALVRFVDTLLK